MPNSRRLSLLAALAFAASVALGVYSCANTRVVGGNRNETVPGPGPGGKPMRTVTDTAVGMPAVANNPIYPVTARVEVNDNYFGTKVADPYRWLEDLDSRPCTQWVTAQNALSRPRLAALPQRAWLKARLTQLWNYERYELPVNRGGAYFYLHNDGKQNQGVLLVAERLDAPGRVLFDPNAAREDATVALSEFTPDVQGDVRRLRGLGRRHGLADVALPARRGRTGFPDELRFTKFWGVSWARDGSGVYYSRYPALPNGTR